MAARNTSSPAPLTAETQTCVATPSAPSTRRALVAAQINLVENQQLANVPRTDAAQHFAHLLYALIAQRIAGIDHVQQQIGLARLLQRRTKSGDQFVRQCAHESHRVRQHHLAHVGQFHAAHGRIERRKQLVGNEGVALRSAH